MITLNIVEPAGEYISAGVVPNPGSCYVKVDRQAVLDGAAESRKASSKLNKLLDSSFYTRLTQVKQ